MRQLLSEHAAGVDAFTRLDAVATLGLANCLACELASGDMRACGLVLHGPASRSQIRSSRACTLIVRSPRLAKRQFRHGAGTAAQCSSASRLVHSSSFLVHGLCQPGKASQINPGIVGLTADPVARDAVENLDEIDGGGEDAKKKSKEQNIGSFDR